MREVLYRRQFMGSAAAAALAGAGLGPERAAALDAFSGYDGVGQRLVRSKQATALVLVDAAIARVGGQSETQRRRMGDVRARPHPRQE